MTPRVAAALTRVLLLLYPRSFRKDLGEALVADVRRRAVETAASDRATLRTTLWLGKLSTSLVANAVALWTEVIARRVSRASALLCWGDFKLSWRMLVKYPGLTLVNSLGIAVAAAIGVGFFALFHARFYPEVPLPQGDRLVGLENWDRRTHQEERRVLFDFTIWRDTVRSIRDLTAFRDVTRNLVDKNGVVEAVRISEITPSGFRLAGVAPLIGRTLIEGDAVPGAPPAIVIGADVWRSRFGAEPTVINTQIQLEKTTYTIVGVMPQGFAFPVNHQYWIPLTVALANIEPGRGPSVFVAGRLAPGVALEDAQVELTAIGRRLSAADPATHDQLRPEVLPYTYPFAGMNANSAAAFWPVSFLVSLILVVVCVNVAILIYARTATRLDEIAVRSALGASRARIVTQLSAESFVLSTGAALIGVGLVKGALAWARTSLAGIGQTHFWNEYTLSPAAGIYAGVLTALAVLITGVVPALRATGRRVQYDLRRSSSGTDLRLGRLWTTSIVVQVATASAALPLAIGLGWFQVRDIFNLPRFAVEQILFAEVALDREPQPGQQIDDYWRDLVGDLSRLQDRLSRRLDAEAAVVSHAFTTGLPNVGRPARIAIEDDSTAAGVPHQVTPLIVGPDFFQTFDVNVLAGRAFNPADFAEHDSNVIIVNRAFVRRWLAPGDALGRRVQFVPDAGSTAPPARWLEIIGVVENIDHNPFGDDLAAPRVYRPLTTSDRGSVRLALRVAAGDRGALGKRLPGIAATLDPALQVKVVPLEEVYRLQRVALTTAAAGIGIALASVLLLSAAGIYALMSFIVTQRRREIAIRTALGAPPARLIGAIFSRALRQISMGVGLGVAVALLIDVAGDGEALGGRGGVVLPSIVVVMAVVGVCAALGPARRGLRIEPIEALRSE